MDCYYAFDYSYILLYNLAFTSLPVIFMGILDQDVDDKVSLAVPQLYRRGIERLEWTQVKFWTYMIDGLYQSVICFFFTYLVFAPATFNTENGRVVSDYKRMGVYIAIPAVTVVNVYMLLNTYRWDWFMLLITSISILLIWLWTGVYTAFTSGFTFYDAAPQVLGALSFWCTFMLTVILCLLPRFASKAFQKIYMPRDVDIVREQIRQGKFDYLKDADPANINVARIARTDSMSDSDASGKPNGNAKKNGAHNSVLSEDMQPMYPPSVAPTATTHNARSQNGSDGTDYTGTRSSLDRPNPPAFPFNNRQANGGNSSDHTPTAPATPTITLGGDLDDPRISLDRPRPSFDRLRSSMDRTRPSFEASRDFTSAAYLARVESSQSYGGREEGSGGASRRHEISAEDVR